MLLAVLMTGIGAEKASAVIVDSSGVVTDWGVTPFVQAGSAAGNHNAWRPSSSTSTWWVEQNNYSAASYPGIGHVPSPGYPGGEVFDLEAVYWRINGGNLQVLLVNSLGDQFYDSPWHRNFRIGDLFIDVDHNGTYDFAVASTNAAQDAFMKYVPGVGTSPVSHLAAPGTLYRITGSGQLVGAVGTGGYGGDPTIGPQVMPWIVDEGSATVIGTTTLTKLSHSYGNRVGGGYYADDPDRPNGISANEDGTWFFEYNLPLSLIDSTGLLNDPENMYDLRLHFTTECGNDLLDTYRGLTQSNVPEPLTCVGLLLGLSGVGVYLARRLGT